MTRTRKILVFIGGGLLAFLLASVGLSIWLTSTSGESFLKHILEDNLSQELGFATRIETLETDLFSRLVLNEVNLSVVSGEDSTILRIQQLVVNYSLKSILRKQLKISQVVAGQVDIHLRSDSTGAWLLGSLLSETEPQSSSEWQVEIEAIQARDSRWDILDRTTGLELKLEDLDLGLQVDQDIFDWDISASWLPPLMQGIRGSLTMTGLIDSSTITISSMALGHPDFTLGGLGQVIYSESPQIMDISLDFSGSPASLLPVLAALTETELPEITGTMDLRTRLTGDPFNPQINFNSRLESFGVETYPTVSGVLEGMITAELIRLDTVDVTILNTPLQGQGQISFDSLMTFVVNGRVPTIPLEQSLSQFYGSQDDYQGVIQGSFTAQGQLAQLEWIDLSADFDIQEASWLGTPIQNTLLNARLKNGAAHLTFTQGLNKLSAKAKIDSIMDLVATLNFDLPDLAQIVPYTPLVGLSGSVSGSASLNRTSGSLQYRTQLKGSSLNYEGFVLDQVSLKVKGVDQNWSIQEGQLQAERANLRPLNKFFSKPALKGLVDYQATVKGNLDNLHGSVKITAEDVWIDTIHLDSTRMSFTLDKQKISISRAVVFLEEQRFTTSGSVNWSNLYGELALAIAERPHGAWVSRGNLALEIKVKKRKSLIDIKAQQFQLGVIAKLSQDLSTLSGVVNGAAHLRFGQTLEIAEFKMDARNFKWASENADEIQLVGRLEERFISLDTLVVKHQAETIALNAKIPIYLSSKRLRDQGHLKADLQINEFDLNRLQTFLPQNTYLEGKASSKLAISGTWFSPQFNGSINLKSLALQMADTPTIQLEMFRADLDGNSALINEMQCRFGDYPLDLTGRIDLINRANYYLKLSSNQLTMGRMEATLQVTNNVLSSTLKLQALDLSLLNFFLEKGQEVQGHAEGILNIKNLTNIPRIEGQLSIPDGFVRLGQDVPPVQAINLNVIIKTDQIQIRQATGMLGTYPFAVTGSMQHTNWDHITVDTGVEIAGIKSLSLTGVFSKEDMDLSILIPNMDLAAWQSLVPNISGLSGQLSGKLALSGSPELPNMDGAIMVRNLNLKTPFVDPALTNGLLVAHFDKTLIHLDSLSFKQGSKGRILVRGDLQLQQNLLPSLNFTLAVDKLKLKQPSVIKSVINTARLSYSGKGEKYTLQGDLQLGATTYQQKITPQDILKIARGSNIPGEQPNPLLSSTSINVKIIDSDQISIHNNLAHIRLKPNLSIIGTLDNPIPTGRLRIEEGYILYLDRRFNVTSASIDFQDPYRINPIVDFHAKCQLKPFQTHSKTEYTVYLDLSGPADAVQMELRSEPALDRTDILTLLTMGATRHQLSQSNPNLDNAKLSRLVQDRVADYSSQKISAFTADRLGTYMNLESISIEGDLFNFGSSWGPQLVASKKIGEKTTLTYSTSVGQATDQNVKLEYEITNGVSVEGQTDQKGHSGLDLKFGWKFK